jgi:tripartite-type tricarboxylate transporter receptor subunit TctC
MHKLVGFLCAVLALSGLWGSAQAQEGSEAFPHSPITLVVPYSAGGPNDTLARILALHMGKSLGLEVNVKNIPGKGGTIGSKQVSQAQADGYTLLIQHLGQATSPFLYHWLPYDVTTDFSPIGLVAELPMMLVARRDLPPRSMSELGKHIKRHKDEIIYADAGLGSASQLCGVLLMNSMGIRLNTESYDGTAPAMDDLLEGKVDLLCDQTANTLRQLKSDKIKAYAVTSPERIPSAPNIPTGHQAGLNNFDLTVWHAVYAPRDTPPAIIETLSNALKDAIADESLARQFAELGATPVSQTKASPEALRQHLQTELERWSKIIPPFNKR